MTKLEKMLKDYTDAQASVEGLKSEIAQLEMDQTRLEMDADAAAKGGNVALYQAKRDEAKQATDTLFVKSKQLEAASCLRTEAEAREAFAEYAASYGKTFAKNLAAYEKARMELYHDFLALVRGQQAALGIRERCAEMAGIDLGNNPAITLDQLFPLPLLPDRKANNIGSMMYSSADMDFFLHLMNDADSELFLHVIVQHLSV